MRLRMNKVMKKYIGKEVRIIWLDSCAHHTEWIFPNELYDDKKNCEPVKIYTYGVVVFQEEDYIVVAQNYGTNPLQYCNLITIPIKCIRTIEKLKWGE